MINISLALAKREKTERKKEKREKVRDHRERHTVCLYFEILFRNDFRDASFFYLIQFMYLKYLIIYVK